MRIFPYIKLNSSWIISTVCILLIVNIILLTSVNISKSIGDILYLDFFVILIEGIFILKDYLSYLKREKYIFSKFKLVNEEEFDNDDYIISIIDKVKGSLTKNYLEKEEKYKKNINDLEEYITTWVHDIKVDIGVLSLLIDEENNIDKIYAVLEKVKFKVNQILSITRANNYCEDILAENVSVCKELRSAIRDNSLFFINKNIEIETDLKEFYIISDRKWIYYIFSQIINNSSKYTKKYGRISIWSVEKEDRTCIHIKDNGVGISKGDISRIFNKGFTGENGRKGTKSTGMGLYYAKRIGEKLNIDILVSSEKDLYTEFIIEFHFLLDKNLM